VKRASQEMCRDCNVSKVVFLKVKLLLKWSFERAVQEKQSTQLCVSFQVLGSLTFARVTHPVRLLRKSSASLP